MNRQLLLGGPGAGKTFSLIEIIRNEIKGGVEPEQIAFVSFTRRAALVARNRAIDEFYYNENSFPWFRTIHSMCYAMLDISHNNVIGYKHIKELGDILGIRITGKKTQDDESVSVSTVGDRMLFIDGIARNVMRPLKDVWYDHQSLDVSWLEMERFSNTYAVYKYKRNILDFTDMLVKFIEYKKHIPVTVAVIDEAQDLTPLQWRVAELAFAKCDRAYIAGDDDQSIYGWAGADIDYFLNLSVDKTIVLPQSHRLPRAIFAVGEHIASGISQRYEKLWHPRDAEGSVNRIADIREIDLTQGTWLLLTRNRIFFTMLEEECRRQEVLYDVRGESIVNHDEFNLFKKYESMRQGKTVDIATATAILSMTKTRKKLKDANKMYALSDLFSGDPGLWHEAFTQIPAWKRAYYVSILRRGEKITRTPKVRIDTIHGVKGDEAENVLIVTDVTRQTHESIETNPDAEARVFYVGVTRAKENLFILEQQTTRSYAL